VVKKEAKQLGISPQEVFTGCLWETVMRIAREGAFLDKTK